MNDDLNRLNTEDTVEMPTVDTADAAEPASESNEKPGVLSGNVKIAGHQISKKKLIIAIVVILVVLACIGAGIAYAMTSSSGQEESPQIEQETTEVSEETPEEEYLLDISVEADGWDAETSSKVIIHVEGDGVDFYHAFDANDANATIAVPKAGDYTVTFISPVNSDGSIYRVPDAATVTATVKDDSTAAKVTPTYKFTKVEASDVTADDLNNIVNQVSEAVKKGDSTLTGENGVAVVEKVKENAKANQNADQTAIENTANTAETDATSGASQATGTVSNSTSGNTSSTSNSNSSSNSGSNSSSATESHTHNWVAQTSTVHHDAVTHEETVYTTVHHDAITKGVCICNGCGKQFETNSAMSAHMESQLLAGNKSCGSYYTTSVVTQQAYDEKVASGTKTVVDQAAYDETVTTGYKCSTCGATK